MQIKHCYRCNKVKVPSDFNTREDAPDKRQYWCRECVATYKADNQHKRKAYNAKYYKSKRYKELSLVRHKTKDPKVHNAQSKLRLAVKTGKIAKPTICSICEQEYPIEKIQGHHPDYDFPYFVRWLCQKCHTHIHKCGT